MNTLLYQTPVGLPESIRERMVNLLNQQLADAIDLQLQSRQVQQNVGGPLFLSLHLLCDQIAINVDEAVSEIAERVAQLGGMALSTKRAIMETPRLPEGPRYISSDDQQVGALCRALESFVASVREAIRTTCDDLDFDSTDVLTHVWQTTDKLLWMVNSYLQRRRPGIGETESSHTSAYTDEGEVA